MSDTMTRPERTRDSLAHRLYTGQLSFNFVHQWKKWFLISVALVLASALALALRGLNLSIDFRGGTAFTVPTTVTATSIDDYRRTVQSVGLPDMAEVKVNTVGAGQVRVETRSLDAEELGKVRNALAAEAKVQPAQVANSLIGGSWGAQITRAGLIALGVFLVLVSLMIWIYFRDWKMSVAAIVALVHDLILTIGVFALLQFSFSPASLIGTLTILGYSLYDTVVVFDKVRENVHEIERQNRTYSEAANTSVNQVLVRSINTTIIGVLPVAALLFAGTFILGTGPLKDLGLALFVGMLAGTYSSVFIATPLLALMREAEPALREHRARLARRAARKAQGGVVSTGTPVILSGAEGAGLVDADTLGALSGGASVPVAPRPAVPGERRQPTKGTRAERKKP